MTAIGVHGGVGRVRALFPPWTNTLARVSVVVTPLAVVVVVGHFMIAAHHPYFTGEEIEVDQPIQFDHRHHTRDDGIDCVYCHHTVETSARAGMPSTAVCMGCHGQIWNDAPILNALRARYFTGERVPWQRVTRMPDFVFFNHAAHTQSGVGCVSCHGRVDLMAAVYPVTPMTMEWCLDCHRDHARHIRPRDAVTDMSWAPPAHARGLPFANLEPPTTCTGCHR